MRRLETAEDHIGPLYVLGLLNSVAIVALGLSLAGCSLHTQKMDDGRTAADWRVGLEDASIAHGKMVLGNVSIDIGSDVGQWCVEAAVVSMGGVGSLVGDAVDGVMGLVR